MVNSSPDTQSELSKLFDLISGETIKCSSFKNVNADLIDTVAIPCLENISDNISLDISQDTKDLIIFSAKVFNR